jgi:LPS sulfotransferase NodH
MQIPWDTHPEAMRGDHRDYRKYIILGHQRSGSSLVVNTLAKHPGIVAFGEIFYEEGVHFNVKGYGKGSRRILELRNQCPLAFLDEYVFTGYRESVAAVGFKVFPDQLDYPELAGVWSWIEHHEELVVVRLKREDLLATYVSRLIAELDGRFSIRHESERSTTTLFIDPDRCMAEFVRRERYHEQARQATRRHEALDLSYEELSRDPAGGCARIQALIGVEVLDLPVTMIRQETRPLSEVIENFDELRRWFAATKWRHLFAGTR